MVVVGITEIMNLLNVQALSEEHISVKIHKKLKINKVHGEDGVITQAQLKSERIDEKIITI